LEALEGGQRSQETRDTAIQTRIGRIETALLSLHQDQERQGTGQQQTHDAIGSMVVWARPVVAGLVLLALLTVGTGYMIWRAMTHLAVVQVIEPPAAPPVPQRQPGKK